MVNQETTLDETLEVLRLAIVADLPSVRLSMPEVKRLYFEIWRLRELLKGDNDES